MLRKGSEPDYPKKPSASTTEKHKEKKDKLPVAQLFLKIIAAQVEVREDEPKFSQQIQDSELVVQTKYDLSYKTKPATGSLMPQWHAGYTFAVRDLNTSLKLKLISTKRLINTTLGKVDIPLETITESPSIVEVPLQKIHKKLKSVKLITVTMCIRDDAEEFARKYSVIKNVTGVWKTPFNHLNSPYFTSKGVSKEHPSFKIVLEKANFFAGEIVRGAIVFDIAQTIDHINYIKLIATCTENSIWTEGSGSNQVTYSDARVKYAVEKYIVSTPNKDGLTMFSGMHLYLFELQLPTLAPSSVGFNGANMTYLMTAECNSVKNRRGNKTAMAFFNVYGPETRFTPPLVYSNPPFHIKKHLRDDWTGEVLLSSQKQYPNRQYGMLIKYHNTEKEPVKDIKVCIKQLKTLHVKKSNWTRDSKMISILLTEVVPMHNNAEEHVQVDFRYTLPAMPPTIAPIDGIELFEFYTIATIRLTHTNGKKSRRVVPITVGTIIPEHVTQEHHVINPDASVASLTVYCAKSSIMVHGLVCYKSTSLQFFDDKIFTSYDKANLVRIENVADVSKEEIVIEKNNVNTNNNNNSIVHNNNNNNTNVAVNSFQVEEDRPMRNKYVDIDDDELPDSDESKSM